MLDVAFRAMGCQMAAYLDSDAPGAAAALPEVPRWFETWEQALSRFRPDSELCRLNARTGQPVRVSAVLWEVIGLALRVAHLWWAWGAPAPATPRVAPQDTRANLRAIAARASERGGEAVPLEPQDADSPSSPEAAVFEQLATRGFVLTSQRAPAEAELGFGSGWPELERGFGPVEPHHGVPGRMLHAVAVLRLDRHEVLIAYGGREAIVVAERERPDLILLDIGMPDMDGYEVTRLLRASDMADSFSAENLRKLAKAIEQEGARQ